MSSMKTMKQIITAIAVLLSAQVFATSDIQIRTNGTDKIIIEATDITGEERIKIFDEKGKLFFSEKIEKNTYVKTFKLNNLPDGKYFVEYENDSKINTAVIVKEANKTSITSDFNQISFKPMINQKGDFLNVAITNPEFDSVNISVIDSNGHKLTEIKNLNTLIVKKTFNTRKLPKGNYSIQVNCGTHSYTKMISIR